MSDILSDMLHLDSDSSNLCYIRLSDFKLKYGDYFVCYDPNFEHYIVDSEGYVFYRLLDCPTVSGVLGYLDNDFAGKEGSYRGRLGDFVSFHLCAFIYERNGIRYLTDYGRQFVSESAADAYYAFSDN